MTWQLLWQIVFVATVVGFAVLAVVTTIGGAIDCLNLFRGLGEDDDQRE